MNLKTIFKEAWEKTFVSLMVRKRNLEDFIDNLPDIEVGEDKPTEWRWEGYNLHTTNGVCKPKDWEKQMGVLRTKTPLQHLRPEDWNLLVTFIQELIAEKDAEIAKYQRREDEHCRILAEKEDK